MTTKRRVLIAILTIGVAAAAVIVYFGPRLSLERRLEKRLNALGEVEYAQLSLPSAPLVGRSGDDSYARATLPFDLTRDKRARSRSHSACDVSACRHAMS